MLLDLVGVKNRALDDNFSASKLMRNFHKIVYREMTDGLKALDHAYVWNDSVLLLAYVDGRSHIYGDALHAADALKRKVDRISPSYAIAVKGRAFPSNASRNNPRFTAIAASSYAMANCFAIEAEARSSKLRKAWYIDARIARQFLPAKSLDWINLPLLPGGKCRRVYLHRGHILGAPTSHDVSDRPRK